MKIKKICPICNSEFEVTPVREHSAKFCSMKCRAVYQRSGAQSEASKKGWSDERKVKQGKKQSITRKSNPVYAEIARKNLEVYNETHKGKGNGRKHSDEHKAYISEIMTGREITWVDKIKETHWAYGDKRFDTIEKMNKTKCQLIATGEITFNNRGISGKYKSLKTGNIETFDSLNELYRMKQLDADNSVLFWTKKHGIIINYILGGKDKNYIPDLLIITNNKKTLEEIKSSWTDLIHKEMNTAKKAAALKFCADNNYDYNWNVFNLTANEQKQLKNEL